MFSKLVFTIVIFMQCFESVVISSWLKCSQVCMHHFVSTDICIGAALCTAPGFIFFVETFLTLMVSNASALVLADVTVLFFTQEWLPWLQTK